MALASIRLSFYGVAAELGSDEAPLIEELRRDFEYFLAPNDGGAERIRWEFSMVRPPDVDRPEGRPSWRARDYAVFDRGAKRTVAFDDPAMAVYDYSLRTGRIVCADARRLHELAYLAVLSRVGEELDLKGLHRAHALGFARRGGAGLLLLPSGGGKSSLALEILRSTDLDLISEDTPLIAKQLQVMPFPLRMGFRASDRLDGVPERWIRPFPRKRFGEKRLVDLGFFRERVAKPAQARWLLIGERRGAARPSIEPITKGQALLSLAKHLVVGYGVAQMSEYMLRPSAIGLLARIALSRARVAAELAGLLPCYRFSLSENLPKNVSALTQFLDLCGD